MQFSQTCLHMIALKTKCSLHSTLQGQEVAHKYASVLLSEPIISLQWLRGNSSVPMRSSHTAQKASCVPALYTQTDGHNSA